MMVVILGGTGTQVFSYMWKQANMGLHHLLMEHGNKPEPHYCRFDADDSILKTDESSVDIPPHATIIPCPEFNHADQGRGAKFKTFLNAADDATIEDILKVFISQDMQECTIDQGFFGMPLVGATVIESKFLDQPDILNELWRYHDTDFLIIGALKGGTGPGLLPVIVRNIKHKMNKAKIAALVFLEHFKIDEFKDKQGHQQITNEMIKENCSAGLQVLRNLTDIDQLIFFRDPDPPVLPYEVAGEQTDRKLFLYHIAAAAAWSIVNKGPVSSSHKDPYSGWTIFERTTKDLSLKDIDLWTDQQKRISLDDFVRFASAFYAYLMRVEVFLGRLPGNNFCGPAVHAALIPSSLEALLKSMGNGGLSRLKTAQNLASKIKQTRIKVGKQLDHFAETLKSGSSSIINEKNRIMPVFDTRVYRRTLQRPASFFRQVFNSLDQVYTTPEEAALEIERTIAGLIIEKYMKKVVSYENTNENPL